MDLLVTPVTVVTSQSYGRLVRHHRRSSKRAGTRRARNSQLTAFWGPGSYFAKRGQSNPNCHPPPQNFLSPPFTVFEKVCQVPLVVINDLTVRNITRNYFFTNPMRREDLR
jgi:hypothetical protein